MLTYKVRGESKFIPINIPYDDDSLYVSPDKTWISGTCDTSAELFDEQVVYLSNGEQFIEATAYTENVLRQGYVIIKESVKVYTSEQYNFDGSPMEIHYIKYNGRYFFEDLSGTANVSEGTTPTGQITMFINDNIRKPVEVGDKEYADIETIIYIEDESFEYDGQTYTNGEDFNLEATEANGYPNFVQQIYFDNGNIGEVHVFEVSDYRKVTNFKIEIEKLETLNVKLATQVGTYKYAFYKNQPYQLLGEGANTYIMTDSGRVDNASDDPNFFVPEDEAYLCTDVCKYKFAVKSTYAKSDSGDKVCLVFNDKPDLTLSDSIQYKSKNILSDKMYVYSTGNENEYCLFLNDMTYVSELNRSFFIKLNDVDYQITMSNIVDDEMPDYTIGYINLHGAPAEIYVNDSYTAYQRYVARDGKFSMEGGEIENRPTFYINDKSYPVFTEKVLTNDGTEIELYYIEYRDYIWGELDIVEILSDTVMICRPKCNFTLASNPEFNSKVYQSNYIAQNYRNLLFSRANDILRTASEEDFIQSEQDAEDEINTDFFSSRLAIIKNGAYMVIPLLLQNGIANNLLQQDVVTNQFYEVEREKSINSIIDMEKDVYHPCLPVSQRTDIIPQNLTEVTEIVFNLHLRTRDMETWEVNEDEGNERNVGLTNWFITDYPYYFNSDTTYADDDELKVDEIVWNDEDKPEDSPNTNNFEQINNEFKADWNRNGINAKDKGGLNIFETSDLLYFMKFDDDDIFYQKSKVAKTFLRLSFYDSPNPKTQSLLYYSTIFLDEGELFKKFINNTKTRDGKEFVEVCRLGYENMSGDTSIQYNWSQCSGNVTNSISVSREYIPKYEGWGEAPNETEAFEVHDKLCPEDREDKRLSLQFKVTNRYQTDDSSDGFYVYIFRDYSLPFTPRSIYMKAELNHAGLGKTIQFMYPRKFSSDGTGDLTHLTLSNAIVGEGDDAKKYEVDPNNAYHILSDDNSQAWEIQGEILQKVSDFREGFDLQDIYYQQYIEFKVIYDDVNKRFCYYLPHTPEEYEDNDNSPYRGTKMILNLWELKIKNDLTETDEG